MLAFSLREGTLYHLRVYSPTLSGKLRTESLFGNRSVSGKQQQQNHPNKQKMRRAGFLLATAPSVYPFQKPFYDTPFDVERGRTPHVSRREKYPSWMQEGIDGTGRGIGLYRAHPLSKKNRGNYIRTTSEIPRIFNMMISGVRHKSGRQLYSVGAKPPNPSKHPYITGAPHPVYGWRVNEPHLIKEFNTPHVSKDQIRYKPYVALHEKGILGSALKESTHPSSDGQSQEKGAKPLLKRLFFWQ